MITPRLRSFVAPALLAAVALGGCSGTSNSTQGASGGAAAQAIPEVRSKVAHDTSPALTGAQKETFVADANAFSFELYRQVAADPAEAGRSVFVSPLSVAFALGMTSAGAKGPTLDQMRQALHFTQPPDATNAGFNWLKMELAKRPAEALATLDPSVVATTKMDWNLVNALFAQDGFAPASAFLDTLSAEYDAGVKVLPFMTDSEGSRQKINGWVDQQTSSRIKDLLPPGSITSNVLFVVANAVSMGAPWQTPFVKGATAGATFTKLDGGTVEAPLMHMAEPTGFDYLANAELEAAALPLLGDQLEVVLVVPKPGKFTSVEASLDGASFAALRASFAPKQLEVAVPRFTFTTDSVSLVKPLSALGMKLAFTDAADFSGISTTRKVQLFDVLHKAMVSFDEAGVQAAAATAVIGGDLSLPPPGTPFVVDRAFLLGIRDKTTGALLFWGRIASPT